MTRTQISSQWSKHCIAAAIVGLLAAPALAQQNAASSAAQSPAEPGRFPTNAAPRAPIHSGSDMVLHAHKLTTKANAVADYTAILALCQQALRQGLNPQFDAYAKRLMAWAYNRRGELLALQGHRAVALADFEAAVDKDPTRWRALHNRALSYAMLGKPDQAITDFDRTLALNPECGDIWFNRAEVYFKLGNFDLAVADYTRALELAPEDAAAYNGRGNAHYRAGRHQDAADDFTAAIQLDPTSAVTLTNRGDLYSELGYYEEAAADYQAAIDADPELIRAHLSAAWLMATCPDRRLRNPEGALAALASAETDGSASDPNYLDILAAAHASAGNFEQAQITAEQAVKFSEADGADVYEERLALYRSNTPFVSGVELASAEEPVPQTRTAPQSRPARVAQSRRQSVHAVAPPQAGPQAKPKSRPAPVRMPDRAPPLGFGVPVRKR